MLRRAVRVCIPVALTIAVAVGAALLLAAAPEAVRELQLLAPNAEATP
jgi:hypothetical protein